MLNPEQLKFINDNFSVTKNEQLLLDLSFLVVNGGKLKTGQVMNIEESDYYLNQWEVSIHESSSGRKEFKCECGRAIKKMYLVRHKDKNIEFSLGSTHIKDFLGITPKKLEGYVVENQKHVKLIEEFEMLIENHTLEKQLYILDLPHIPMEIKNQLKLGIPLNHKQINTLFKDKDKELYHLISKLDQNSLTKLNDMSKGQRLGFCIKLKNGTVLRHLRQIEAINFEMIEDRLKEDHQAKTFFSNSPQAPLTPPNKADFLKQIISEEERISIEKNTKLGEKKYNGTKPLPRTLSSFFDRQIRNGFSMSDMQWHAYHSAHPKLNYPWTDYYKKNY